MMCGFLDMGKIRVVRKKGRENDRRKWAFVEKTKAFFFWKTKENGIPLEQVRKICLKKGGSMNTYIVPIVCPKFCQNMGKILEKACLSCLEV